mmetsp:Transcript_30241/g.46318  ORF Transcript_30241/g.46318 Transcript_30241/m.46318 type:complete len:217 (+) Transcript_30241:253-903(+)
MSYFSSKKFLFVCSTKSLSVDWNSSGSWIVAGCSDQVARIWSLDGNASQAREVTTLSPHGGMVDLVRCHPQEAPLMCTVSQDRYARVWDVRAGSGGRNIWKADLVSKHPCAEWHHSKKLLVCVDREETIKIYDLKMNRSTPLKTIPLAPLLVGECRFSPGEGDHLLVATLPPQRSKMGELRILPNWAQSELSSSSGEKKETDGNNNNNNSKEKNCQ